MGETGAGGISELHSPTMIERPHGAAPRAGICIGHGSGGRPGASNGGPSVEPVVPPRQVRSRDARMPDRRC